MEIPEKASFLKVNSVIFLGLRDVFAAFIYVWCKTGMLQPPQAPEKDNRFVLLVECEVSDGWETVRDAGDRTGRLGLKSPICFLLLGSCLHHPFIFPRRSSINIPMEAGHQIDKYPTRKSQGDKGIRSSSRIKANAGWVGETWALSLSFWGCLCDSH